MPAVGGPPSLVLKYLIWVALGLPRSIVHATIVPARGADRRLVAVATFTWKPVVRLTAKHGVAGQLGTVSGLVVGGITPTSVSVAGATAGRASTRARLASGIAVDMRLMWAIQHERSVDVAVE